MKILSQMEPWGRGHEGHHPGMFLVGCLLVVGIVVLAVMLYRNSRHVVVHAPVAPNPSTMAEAILAERLARGEVSVEDFTAARAALRGESVATPPTQ
jgi:uncharacterized membrane protein